MAGTMRKETNITDSIWSEDMVNGIRDQVVETFKKVINQRLFPRYTMTDVPLKRFISTPHQYDSPLKSLWEEVADTCNCWTFFPLNYQVIFNEKESETMTLKQVTTNLKDPILPNQDGVTDIRHCKVTVRKIADGLTLRVAAVAEKSGVYIYTDPTRIYTIKSDGESCRVDYSSYYGSKKSRQEAIDYVMEKVADDYTRLLNIKFRQIEDAVFFKQVAGE